MSKQLLPPDAPANSYIEQALAEAMNVAWPGHTEGSGSSGTQYTVPPPEVLYRVKDPCLPSPDLVRAILATPSMQAITRELVCDCYEGFTCHRCIKDRQAAIGAAVERLDDHLGTFRFGWNDHRSLGYQVYKFGKPSITVKAPTLQEAITEADEYLAALEEDDE